MAYEVGLALQPVLIEGNVDEVERIIRRADRSDFSVNTFIGDYVKGTGQFLEPTALTMASAYGHADCVRKILELGDKLYTVGTTEDEDDDDLTEANVYLSEDYFGALVIAASKGHSEIVQLLAEFRLFSVTMVLDEYKEFVAAAKDGDFQRIKSLMDSVVQKDMFLKGWKGHNIMNLCLLLGCPSQCLQNMIDNGIGVNGWDYNGLAPLMCAIIGKNLECVKFLLDKGADPYEIHILRRMSFQDDGAVLYIDDMGRQMDLEPNFREEWLDFHQDCVGPTALMYAAAMGNIPILKLMLEVAPKDIGSWGRFERHGGIGPLMYAIDYAGVEAVSLILQFDAAKEEVGDDPLCHAICDGKTEVFELLLSSDIVWTDLDTMYGFAMLKCVHKKNSQYLGRILSCIDKNVFEVDDGRALFCAIDKDATECVNLFISRPDFSVELKCANSHFYSAAGLTSFMYSCRKGKEEFAKMFLDMGANKDYVENTGKTAVMFAARENRVKCLEFLNDCRADFDVVDRAGGTVFSASLMADGSCLEYMLRTRTLFDEHGVLKPIHKQSVKMFGIDNSNDGDDGFGDYRKAMPIKNIQLLIEYKTFYWAWCSMVDKGSFRNIVFAAMTSGVSPGTFKYDNQLVSPFIYAVMVKEVVTVRYLLANLFFLPQDYAVIYKSSTSFTKLDDSPELAFLIEQLILRPLSLQMWSTLTITESIVPSGAVPIQRNRHIDTLPLPTVVKDTLGFRKEYSQLCPRHWKRLGPQQGESGNNDKGFNFLMVNGSSVRNPILKKCAKWRCPCGGSGLTMEDIDGLDKAESVGEETNGAGGVENVELDSAEDGDENEDDGEDEEI